MTPPKFTRARRRRARGPGRQPVTTPAWRNRQETRPRTACYLHTLAHTWRTYGTRIFWMGPVLLPTCCPYRAGWSLAASPTRQVLTGNRHKTLHRRSGRRISCQPPTPKPDDMPPFQGFLMDLSPLTGFAPFALVRPFRAGCGIGFPSPKTSAKNQACNPTSIFLILQGDACPVLP